MSLNNRLKKLEQFIKERAEDKNAWKSNEDNLWGALGISEEQLQQCKTEDEAWNLVEVDWEDDN